jgi:ATP-dependent RNA helicase RhlE
MDMKPQTLELKRRRRGAGGHAGPPAGPHRGQERGAQPGGVRGARRGRPHARHRLPARPAAHPVLPAQAAHHDLLFSATFSPEIKRLANSYLQNPVTIEVARPNETASTVEQRFYSANDEDKRRAIHQVLKTRGIKQAFIFVNSKLGCARLARSLEREGLKTTALHGDKSQDERLKALDAFKAGEVDLLVATDVAARGLDIKDVPAVFNFDVPFNAEDYVHRIGRTGRAGASGLAVTLVRSRRSSTTKTVRAVASTPAGAPGAKTTRATCSTRHAKAVNPASGASPAATARQRRRATRSSTSPTKRPPPTRPRRGKPLAVRRRCAARYRPTSRPSARLPPCSRRPPEARPRSGVIPTGPLPGNLEKTAFPQRRMVAGCYKINSFPVTCLFQASASAGISPG